MDNTVEQTAEKLKLSTATIRRMILARELTAIRAGRRKWIVPDEAIADYRARQTSSATPRQAAGEDTSEHSADGGKR